MKPTKSTTLRNVEREIRQYYPYGRYRKAFKTQTPEGRANFLHWIQNAITFQRVEGGGRMIPKRYSVEQIEELGRRLKVPWNRHEIVDWHYNEMNDCLWLYRTRGADLIQIIRRR